jgi:DNA polymerase-3 subunit epsilon
MTLIHRSMPQDIDEAAVMALSASPDYRVLKRFAPRRRYADPALLAPAPLGPKPFTGLITDVETTGLDPEDDKIIELAGVEFSYDHNGVVYEVLSDFTYLEDPGVPLSAEIQALTHLTDDDLKGRHIDDRTVADAVRRADIIIAHNAEFDRPRVEKRIPVLTANKPWACSQREVPWNRHVPAIAGAKLIHILEQGAREFYDAHRALDDCYATLHSLAGMSIEDKPTLLHLLESARKPIYRVFAVGTEFYMTKYLKARRSASGQKYRWSDGKNGKTKAWFIDVRGDELAEEKAWLASPKLRCYRPKIDQIIAQDRYSVRAEL